MHVTSDSSIDSTLESPIFLLGCSWRCGSTLLQRLLSTIDGLVIWGENVAAAGLLQQACERLRSRAKVSTNSRSDFEKKGALSWMANMSPPVDGVVEQLSREWLLGLYGPPTLELGKTRWGFKEVRHDATVADFLVRLFPLGRVVLLLRNPVDVLASLHSRKWYHDEPGGAQGSVRHWTHNAKSFLDARDRHVLVRYEDLIGKPTETLGMIEKSLGIAPGAIDPAPLEVKLRGPEPAPPSLGRAEVAALRNPDVVNLAAECGYDLLHDPRLRNRGLLATLFP